MATGGRLHCWVSGCFILIAFCVFLLMLREVGGENKQKQTFLYLGRASVEPVYWPSINVSIQDVSVLYSHQMIPAPIPLVAESLFLPFVA